MTQFAVLTGHLTRRSRPGAIARALADELRPTGADVIEIAVGEIPHSALMAGNHDHPAVRRTQRALTGADAVAVVLPRYDPHGSTPLWTWLAMLPPRALDGKPALPIGLGTLRSHSIGLANALPTPDPLPPTYLYDTWFTAPDWTPTPRAQSLLHRAATTLRTATHPALAAA